MALFDQIAWQLFGHTLALVLATLAILVWHFYQVFFDPDVYPMNWAWWDGPTTAHRGAGVL